MSRCSLRHGRAHKCAGYFATMPHAPKMNSLTPSIAALRPGAVQKTVGGISREKGKESLREADRQAKGIAEVARKTVNEIKADLASQ